MELMLVMLLAFACGDKSEDTGSSEQETGSEETGSEEEQTEDTAE